MFRWIKPLLHLAVIVVLVSCASAPVNSTLQDSNVSRQGGGDEASRRSDNAATSGTPTSISSAQDLSQAARVDAASTKAARTLDEEDDDESVTASAPVSPEVQEQQETLDQALELLNQSQDFWQNGDVDNALKCLDEAYALILEVNGAPEIVRQKDDLRSIISRRIVEITTTRYTIAKGMQSEIPMIMNADVEREIKSFQTVERGFFTRSYLRSGRYRAVIVKTLEEAGLPKELSWLPLVESGFQCNALSTARALGLWQFIPSTGYRYAVQRDRWVDERLDPEKSTRAAIAYLQELHGMFGDWLTCLAAYNCGEGRVLRVIAKQRLNYLDHFWDLYRQLPNETARYVPRFLATLHIMKDPKKYGFDFNNDEMDKPIPYETVRVEKSMRLQDIAEALNASKDTLSMLNTELKLQVTPDKPYTLKLPVGLAAQLTAGIDKIPEWEQPRQSGSSSRSSSSVWIRHKVRKGESLNGIARRYKTTPSVIMEANDLSGMKVKPGQVIKVPGKGYAKKSGEKSKDKNKSSKGEDQGNEDSSEKIIKYKVKKGDTLASVARRYGMKLDELRKLNGINGSQLNVGQVIKVKDKDKNT